LHITHHKAIKIELDEKVILTVGLAWYFRPSVTLCNVALMVDAGY